MPKSFRILGRVPPIALAVMACAASAAAQGPATVVDTNRRALDAARQPGAPEFGFDVSAQTERSSTQAGVRFPYLRFPPFPIV